MLHSNVSQHQMNVSVQCAGPLYASTPIFDFVPTHVLRQHLIALKISAQCKLPKVTETNFCSLGYLFSSEDDSSSVKSIYTVWFEAFFTNIIVFMVNI